MRRTTIIADLVLAKKLDELFRDHRQMLWGLAYRMTGCAADAEDIVQETFARVAAHSTPVRDHTWRPWLVRVATNLSLDADRRLCSSDIVKLRLTKYEIT
jgi:RNA polymerase sigma factor (sigma-70 family)